MGYKKNIRLNGVNVVRQINQRGNMDGKLPQNRANDVDVENVRLGSFLRQAFHRLVVLSFSI